MQLILLLPILLPVLAGLLFLVLSSQKPSFVAPFSVGAVLLCAAVSVFVLLAETGTAVSIFQILPGISVMLGADGAGVVFGMMLALLWAVTVVYAVGYMKDSPHSKRFFGYFIIAFGVANGIALSANAVTLYLFYELLAFATYPLLTFSGTDGAYAAGKKYLVYVITGAGLSFAAVVAITWMTSGAAFQYGGGVSVAATQQPLLQIVYFVGFMGFGAEAAVFPFHGWLPSAHVAPTPVTALLHAVSMVKSGVFGILRLTYYCFDPALLSGGWAQRAVFAVVSVTILYGASTALRTTHLKRRLAYSTVSQLSCMLMAALMLTPAGLQGALIYMVFHAIIKTTLFFCCGYIQKRTGLEDIRDMYGLGRGSMALPAICFLIASLALTGVPPTAGFIGKWYLAGAAAASADPLLGALGIAVILLGSLFSALYLLPFSFKLLSKYTAPRKMPDSDSRTLMLAPIALLALAIVFFGLFPSIITAFIETIGVV